MWQKNGLMCATVLAGMMTGQLIAADYKPGERVVVIADAKLMSGAKAVDYVWPGLTLTVLRDNGPSLTVSNGTPGNLDEKNVIAWGTGDNAGAAAIAAITELVKAQPQDPRLLCGRADVWRRMQDFTNALKDCDEAIKLSGAAEFYGMRGSILYEDSKFDEAVRSFNEAIQRSKTNSRLYNNRGLARIRRWLSHNNAEDFGQILGDFSEAIRLDPQYANAYFNRGNAYLANNQLNEAITDYSSAIARDSNHASAYANRGLVRLVTSGGAPGSLDLAIDDLKSAVQEDPSRTTAYIAGRIATRFRNDTINMPLFRDGLNKTADSSWPNGFGSYINTDGPINGNQVDEFITSLESNGDYDRVTEVDFYIVLDALVRNRTDPNVNTTAQTQARLVWLSTNNQSRKDFIETWLAKYINDHPQEFGL